MEQTKRKQVRKGMDMLHGSIADKLFFFAMPVGLMGMFEQLFNSADVFILGRFVGKDAMAAVGNNMPVIGLLVTLLMGISLGANVVIAQYLGARKDEKVEATVQTAILLSLGMGLALMVIGELIVSPALMILAVPDDVYPMAELYLRIFLLGLPFLSLYNFEAAVFRSCGDGRTPLYSLVAANAINIVLDLLSVTVLGLGLTGVVVATVLSFAVNAGILFVLLCRTADRIRLQRHHMCFSRSEGKTMLSAFGLDALVLFKQKKMAIFFLFSMLLGAALQITNTYGDLFLSSFASIPQYADSFGVKHSVILLSISQMSETLFILAIPFFLKHFGIKRVMLISMFAWVFRFGLFGLGDPGSGLWMLILSMIVYGMAFDFFNVSGSLFTEMEAHPSIRASAQGLFFMMTNGLGAIIGGYASGAVVDAFSVYAPGGGLISREWTPVWLIFAGYALVIGILFGIVFRYKHTTEKETGKVVE